MLFFDLMTMGLWHPLAIVELSVLVGLQVVSALACWLGTSAVAEPTSEPLGLQMCPSLREFVAFSNVAHHVMDEN